MTKGEAREDETRWDDSSVFRARDSTDRDCTINSFALSILSLIFFFVTAAAVAATAVVVVAVEAAAFNFVFLFYFLYIIYSRVYLFRDNLNMICTYV